MFVKVIAVPIKVIAVPIEVIALYIRLLQYILKLLQYLCALLKSLPVFIAPARFPLFSCKSRSPQAGGKDIDYRAFSCPIWPEKGENLAFPDGKTDVIDGFYVAKRVFEIFHFDYIA